ncbi:MAG: hypothetical protein ACK46Y_18135 [Fluviicola sp.]|jgi:cupin superfamily acireductone dioxygenase involved in methionine salvage
MLKISTLIFLLFFVGNLSAQRTVELQSEPLLDHNYLKITNGQFIFWIEQKDFYDIFLENDLVEIKPLIESVTETVSIEYLTTEISKITQETEDLDKEIRYLILGEDLFIERISDGLFLSEYTVLTKEKIRSLVDDQGELIIKEWTIIKSACSNPSF